MQSRIVRAVAGVATLVAGGTLVSGTAASAGGAGVAADHTGSVAMCGQVRAARVIAHRDINGDGRRDTVRELDAGLHHARLRVNLAGGGHVTRTVKGPWVQVLGAAPLGGRRGAEIVAANKIHANKRGETFDSRVLTMGKHRLVRLPSPTGGTEWKSHAWPRLKSGWATHRRHGRLYVTHKTVRRHGHSKRYVGRAVSFRRWGGTWHRTGSRKISFANRHKAERILGWRVRGIQAWIGC